jgi:hypothetical protein
MQPTPMMDGRTWPRCGSMALTALWLVAACGSHRTGPGTLAGPDSSAPFDVSAGQDASLGPEDSVAGPWDAALADGAAPDASTAEADDGCEEVRFEGTLNGKSFAEALRTMRASGPGARAVVLRGARDTKGLECFANLIAEFQIVECGGPLRITSMPLGTLRVDAAEDCPLLEIPGLENVAEVHLVDASAVEDFSPLVGASRVGIRGYPPLGLIAPYVQQAQMLELSISASSLAPLGDAQATQATLNVRGTTSLADYQPSALTCFSIHLEDLAVQDEAAAIAPLCTAIRDGRQCPTYRGCFKDPV